MADKNNTFISYEMAGRSNPLDPFNLYPDFPNTNATLQKGRESEWNPSSLGTTTKTYNGNLADITALAIWCPTKFFSYRTKEQENQIYSITITLPYDEITNADNTAPETVSWEILANTINRNIFDAGIFVVNGAALDTSARYTVPPEVQAAILLAVANNDTLALANDKKYAPLAGIAQQFYGIIKSGQTQVKANLHTLKRTATFNINNQNAYDNYPLIQEINEGSSINPVISTPDLVNLFQMDPEKVSHLIPSYTKFKTSTAQGDPFTLAYKGGYLVGRPQTVYLTPTKIQITQLFEFDEWNDQSYPVVGSETAGFPPLVSTPYPPTYTGKAT
jgi:hypothetical protein